MAPITTYTDSPVTAQKPSGVTPQTTAPAQDPSAAPPTTTAPASQPAYPAAQPAAAPSQPTTTAASQAYTPQGAQPTPTRTTAAVQNEGPPPPQPGAVPSAPIAPKSAVPPPPKVGEKFVPPQPARNPQPPSVPYPQQMSVPPPSAHYGVTQPGTSTAPSTLSQHVGPTTLPGTDGGQGTAYPPVYPQNGNPVGSYPNPVVGGGFQPPQQSPAQGDDSDQSWGSTAKKWAEAAGSSLAAGESKVWEMINKQ